MTNFVKLGNSVIRKDSILSAQIINIEYPTKEEVSTNIEEKKGLFSKLFNAMSSIDPRVIKNITRVLSLKINEGENSKTTWFYNDMLFHEALCEIIITYNKTANNCANPQFWDETNRPSRYQIACSEFIDNSPGDFMPIDKELEEFLNDLIEN
jgi:hypothetical protein